MKSPVDCPWALFCLCSTKFYIVLFPIDPKIVPLLLSVRSGKFGLPPRGASKSFATEGTQKSAEAAERVEDNSGWRFAIHLGEVIYGTGT
jgi:hypothetical protein